MESSAFHRFSAARLLPSDWLSLCSRCRLCTRVSNPISIQCTAGILLLVLHYSDASLTIVLPLCATFHACLLPRHHGARRMLFLARSVRMPLPHALPSPCVHAAMTGRATHSQPSAAAHPSLYDRCLFILSSVPLGEVQSAPGLFLRVSGVSRQRRVVAVACPAWTDFPLCRCRLSGIRWWYPRFDKKKPCVVE